MASNTNKEPARRVYPSDDNANRYYDLAIDRYGMEPEEARQWVSRQLGYTPILQPLANQIDSFNDKVDGKTLVKEIVYGAITGGLTAGSMNPSAIAAGSGIGAMSGLAKTILDGYTSGESQSRKREDNSIARTKGLTNPDFNEPQWGHQNQSYPKYDN